MDARVVGEETGGMIRNGTERRALGNRGRLTIRLRGGMGPESVFTRLDPMGRGRSGVDGIVVDYDDEVGGVDGVETREEVEGEWVAAG